MLSKNITGRLLDAVRGSPGGIARLENLETLGIGNRGVVRQTLSRLAKDGRILRLKRGTYSANPPLDAYLCAQNAFNGYLGFSSALHIHGIISETPFTIAVVTSTVSAEKPLGQYTLRAVALKRRALGFGRIGDLFVSTKAKTLFDCLTVPRYSVERDKLVEAFRRAGMSGADWKEFRKYVEKFSKGRAAQRLLAAGREIRR